jgi:single-stranded-DNA-specific exonuclease
MSTIAKRWQVLPPAPTGALPRFKQFDPVLAQILYHRGIEDADSANRFLYENNEAALRAVLRPELLKDVEPAARRLHMAIARGEKIAVYGDFDCDGVTSTALMMQVLTSLGAAAVAYIPDRVDEGYGLNSPALLRLADEGFRLVVTVDCGIRSVQEVSDAAEAGLDVIVTDHHSVGPEIPNALAVINPQQIDCGGHAMYQHLAGCGVAFMLALQLLRTADSEPRLRISDLLDLVAIGTVADVMRLNDPVNRLLVSLGLQVLNEGRRLGVRVLAQASGLRLGTIRAMDIGFGFGPRINAAGRLKHALIAYELLSTNNERVAERQAEELNRLNQRRQELMREAQARIRTAIEQDGTARSDLIFAQDDEVLAGIVGLVAGRLTEEYYRPTVILERGAVESRASCRSIPEFHITAALDDCAELLVRHGGHAMAAGFTVLNENLPMLRSRLLTAAETALEGRDLAPVLLIDLELELHQLSLALARKLLLLEPTGHHNEPPVFLTRGVRVVDKRAIGKENKHLKLKLAQKHVAPIEAVAFSMGDWLYEMPDMIDVAYTLEINPYNGREILQMRVMDLRPAEVLA